MMQGGEIPWRAILLMLKAVAREGRAGKHASKAYSSLLRAPVLDAVGDSVLDTESVSAPRSVPRASQLAVLRCGSRAHIGEALQREINEAHQRARPKLCCDCGLMDLIPPRQTDALRVLLGAA
eukprot:3592465-Rhodomonas_salina.1